MKILAFESSCDETAVAVVEDGRTILAESIASQIPIHRRFGGVVPEVASRAHLEQIIAVTEECLSGLNNHSLSSLRAEHGSAKARTLLREGKLQAYGIDAIAATVGPGLLGSLMVGAHFARGLAQANDLPFIPVNHLEGHLAANYIDRSPSEIPLPALGLIVSGGHTLIVSIPKLGTYMLIGQTLDDAAGEAFDKVGQLLGLPYPGGPEIEKLAKSGSLTINLPRAMTSATERKAKNYNLSFSGLKTAVRIANKDLPESKKANLAASFQAAVVDALVTKLQWAIEDLAPKSLLAGGGVIANKTVSSALENLAQSHHIPVFIPPMKLCTDNAAVIGAAAYHRSALKQDQPLKLDPNLPLATS